MHAAVDHRLAVGSPAFAGIDPFQAALMRLIRRFPRVRGDRP